MLVNDCKAIAEDKRTVTDELSDMLNQIERLEEKSGMLAAHIKGESIISKLPIDDIIYDDGLAHFLFCLTGRIARCASIIDDLVETVGNPARLSPCPPKC